ncbi:DUF4167 domain-containing protein [Altererythrobacter xixiisoli]|uniref:DUF4167 domain-containing protein n=1 Tax=Croceibacterium xixiisoli TaxID=1476466 RepID=A0A6I4TZT1_9SPHN|nr:DUF4167 domain-containing protein [Croceibacterium xixiisoli]MXP00188.1 DUF4167 domain-containing protein [Croceibacterium xixiisoli]
MNNNRNNNNNNNNRRRGRGNNRGSNGGQQLNRIDSRARGNAPQLLEKYRKLAHDASLNGDRVQTEYYLQFADHYFRVLADSKVQKDEFRARRDNDRDPADEDEAEDFDDLDQGNRQPAPQQQRNQRRPRDEESEAVQEGVAATEGSQDDEPEIDNPFLRDVRPAAAPRTPRPRTRAPRREQAEDAGTAAEEPQAEARAEPREPREPRRARASAKTESASLDPGLLPPSIPRDTSEDAPADEEKPRRAPRARTRRPRSTEDGGEEALETVS